jgi:hypothetical protein
MGKHHPETQIHTVTKKLCYHKPNLFLVNLCHKVVHQIDHKIQHCKKSWHKLTSGLAKNKTKHKHTENRNADRKHSKNQFGQQNIVGKLERTQRALRRPNQNNCGKNKQPHSNLKLANDKALKNTLQNTVRRPTPHMKD